VLDKLYILLSVGLIVLGIVGLYGSIFKYSKEQHKKMTFTSTGQGLDGVIYAIIMNLMPWWFAKTILILSSLLAVLVGVMMLLTM
jgi:cell division protein FtsW (lipid II flippase)